MKEFTDIKLSILVITHNQVNLLPRCIESLLQQIMNFNYEIIIGVDRSTDGTWELVQSYEKKYPKLIYGYHINSDVCNPTVLSERSGYNRTIAYKKSRGEYFVEVDGDDYIIGDDLYQKQVEMLDSNPECSLCMQNLLCVKEGNSIDNGELWFKNGKFRTGQIISAQEYILNHYFIQHQAFVYRKNKNIDPVSILGKHYEDTTITLFHLQFGSIVYIDKHDYVCVRYKASINSSLTGDDMIVTYCLLPLHHIFYLPKFSGMYIKAGVSDLNHLTKLCIGRQMQLKDETKLFFSQFEGFIYNYFQKDKLTLYDKMRFFSIRILILIMKRLLINSTNIFRFTYALMTNCKEMSKINKNYWALN